MRGSLGIAVAILVGCGLVLATQYNMGQTELESGIQAALEHL